jgi:hypothetical protein
MERLVLKAFEFSRQNQIPKSSSRSQSTEKREREKKAFEEKSENVPKF